MLNPQLETATRSARKKGLNQRGISTLELVPVLVIFALIVNYTLGFFGIIHSGILNSIAARNYTFETFRNRAQLTYLRDVTDEDDSGSSSALDDFKRGARYTNFGYRYHGVVAEKATANSRNLWVATKRPLKFTDVQNGVEPVGDKNDHQTNVRSVADTGKVSDTFSGDGVTPVWVQSMYGICLNSKCAPDK